MTSHVLDFLMLKHNMRFWQKLTRFWLVWVVPAMIVFYSLLWSLPDPQTYQKALAATNFYYEIARIAQKNLVSTENIDNFSLQTLAIVTVFGNFSQSQLQDLVEGNILAWTDWLSGRSSNLAVYIPVDQLELVLANNLDRTIQTIARENKLPECSEVELQNLKQGNLASNFKFCLPSEVNNIQTSFLDFLDLEIGKIASNLLAEDSFSLSRSRYFLADLDNLSTPLLISLTQQLNQVRDWLLLAKAKIWWVIGLTLLILLLHLLLTIFTNQDLWLEITWLFGSVASRLLALILGFILILGASVFWIFQMFRVGLHQSVVADLIILLLKTSLYLGFYLNERAVGVMGVAGLGFFLARLMYRRNQDQVWRKNQQLLEYEPNYQQASTFDSQFKRALTELTDNSTEDIETTFPVLDYPAVNHLENQTQTFSKTPTNQASESDSGKSQLPAVKLKVKSKIIVVDANVPPAITSASKNSVDSNLDIKTNHNSKKIQL